MQDQPAFTIRQIPVCGDLILAPMDGFSDQPFRSLCRRLGSAMSYTEFINAIDVLQGHPALDRKLAFLEEERPLVYQFFDNQPERLLEAVKRLSNRRPDIIDVNMGCSVRSVSGRGAGAGLLRDPRLAARVVEVLCRGQELPVTAKIRLGWDDEKRNYLDVARALEESGAALIAVHGRTKAQGYSGEADWDAIAAVRQAVSIPVIANGDVRTVADIERIKAHTGCQAVMIGRAAIGNPWIFARLDRDQVPAGLVRETLLRHLQSMLAFYGQEKGLVLFRKHASRYIGPLGLSAELRRTLLTCVNPEIYSQVLGSTSALSEVQT